MNMRKINELHSAVENGQLENVKDLLNQYDLDSEVYVLLRKSINLKHTEITTLLLTRESRENCKRRKTIPLNTALHAAVQNGDIETIKMLLNCDADIDAQNENNLTPLLCAVSLDNEEIVDLLLNRGSNLNNNNCISPLHVAVIHGLYKMTEKLLQLGACVNSIYNSREQYTPLHRAASMSRSCDSNTNPIGDLSIVKLLLKHGANINFKTTKGMTPLHLASITGNLQMVKTLLSGNADVNACENNMLTPLYLAIQNRHTKAAQCLIDHGANIDAESKNGQTVLNLAVCNSLSMIVEHILKYCPDRNNASNTNSLKIAVKKSHAGITENLLKYGFSVGPEDINDTDLLHDAIRMGLVQIIQDLIKHGLDCSTKKEEELTMLHIASKTDNTEVVKVLLENKADIEARDIYDRTPLCIAVGEDRGDVVKLLLDSGSDINSLNASNNSALDLYDRSDFDSDESYLREIYEYESGYTFRIIRSHLIKLKTANLYVREKDLILLNYDPDGSARLHTQKCEDEIKNLKLKKIANNRLSFYDILTKNIHSLAKYSGNEQLIKVFESDFFEAQFPIYAHLIKKRFEKCTQRRLLLQQAQEFLKYYSELPHVCIDYILSYLSHDDLENIINAWKTI